MKKYITINEKQLSRIISESIHTIIKEWDGIEEVTDETDLAREAIKKGFKYIAYHNSDEQNLIFFDIRKTSGIHFGSLKAATQRGKDRNWYYGKQNWTKKYFLKIDNPLLVEKDFDWECSHIWDDADDEYMQQWRENEDFYAYLIQQGLADEGSYPYEDISNILKRNGYDAVIYKNECEDAGNYSVAMFNPNNIKLAEQTYDNSNNPIPLEQRFNTSIKDVRY